MYITPTSKGDSSSKSKNNNKKPEKESAKSNTTQAVQQEVPSGPIAYVPQMVIPTGMAMPMMVFDPAVKLVNAMPPPMPMPPHNMGAMQFGQPPNDPAIKMVQQISGPVAGSNTIDGKQKMVHGVTPNMPPNMLNYYEFKPYPIFQNINQENMQQVSPISKHLNK